MLEQARKLDPGIGERFMLFVRDREQARGLLMRCRIAPPGAAWFGAVAGLRQHSPTSLISAHPLTPAAHAPHLLRLPQKQRQGTGGSDGSYDLLSYVEFTNSYRAVVESHTGALKAIRNFWRQARGGWMMNGRVQLELCAGAQRVLRSCCKLALPSTSCHVLFSLFYILLFIAAGAPRREIRG